MKKVYLITTHFFFKNSRGNDCACAMDTGKDIHIFKNESNAIDYYNGCIKHLCEVYNSGAHPISSIESLKVNEIKWGDHRIIIKLFIKEIEG